MMASNEHDGPTNHVAFQRGTLRILADSSVALLTGAECGTIQPALYTWPCARAIANVLCDDPTLVRDRRVLELGAGTGLAGMVAAALGARHVVLSDQTQDARLYESWKSASVANLGLNGLVERCQVVGLEWGDVPSDGVFADGFDIVLAADLVYQADGHDDGDTEDVLLALFATIAGVLGRSAPDAFVLMAVHDRDTGHSLLAHEVAQHFGLEASSWPTASCNRGGCVEGDSAADDEAAVRMLRLRLRAGQD
jgi:hypothetical protein